MSLNCLNCGGRTDFVWWVPLVPSLIYTTEDCPPDKNPIEAISRCEHCGTWHNYDGSIYEGEAP